MRSDVVTIEPEIVQFGRDNTQTIKIINTTSNSIPNFFFCLYNAEKFAFTPDSFSLAPNEHKLITITLKIKSARSGAKEFAYLKSTDINKRITLLLNNFQSPEVKSRQVEEGFEDINTLSSRQYRDVQTQAIQKIIKEKEAYIAMLQRQREGVNRNINFRTEQSAEKAAADTYKREAAQFELKFILVANQKQSLLKENQVLQTKFEEYRKLCQSDLKNYQKVSQQYRDKLQQSERLYEEMHYLQQQGNQFLKKIEEKEEKIRDLQLTISKVMEENKKDIDKKLGYMQERLDEQKKIYQQTIRSGEDRIREFEKKIQMYESVQEKNNHLQRQLRRKDEQVKSLMQAIQKQKNILKQFQNQKKKYMKFEMMNETITEKNNELTSRVKQLEKFNHNLRQQIYVYKGKMAENDVSSDKMTQYMEIALESCRTENDVLKRTKTQLQKSLDEFMSMNRQTHDSNKMLTDQLNKYKEEIKLVMEIKDNLERRNEEIKQENHLAMMQLKTENIELLEKLSLGETSKREDRIKRLEDQLISKHRQFEKTVIFTEQLKVKNEQLVIENTKLGQRVKKYKKQAKKELRSINDTAINQLHKEHEQKKQMAKRIIELQEVILNYSCQKARQSKQEHHQRETQTRLHCDTECGLRKQRASSRIIGIKDQRRQLQYSQVSNNEIYSELGQLRQLNNYLKNQQERFNRMFDIEDKYQNEQSSDLKTESKPFFRVMKFFKQLQNKIRQLKQGEGQLVNIRQIQYLKGRIKELQSIKEQKENHSSINLNKTREHCSQLLEFVRQQMKNQYKKLNDTLKLWERKYQLLKKKIYEQYRAKIIDFLNKKQKNNICQLEAVLERFIEGMSNLSHKEAVLHKEVKLKQNARKQNTELKQKVSELNNLLQSKKGYCTRDPIKLLYNESELQWQQSLKRQAEFLTLSAEYQRLKQEFQLVTEELEDSQQQNKRMLRELDEKSNQVLRLKKYQVQIQSNYESQIQKQYEIIQQNKRKIMEMTKTTKETIRNFSKQKEYHNLKDNLQKQKEVIKQLRDKEKMLEQILEETHRSEQKEKRKINEENRITETMRDLKQGNRQLRSENGKLKQKVAKLEDQLQKKNAYLKNVKGDLEQNRIRVLKKDEIQSSRLKQQIKKLTQQLKKCKDEIQKSKKKKQKDFAELRNQIDRLRNENLITEKSLQSIIRALMDTIRKTYGRLKRVIKKKRGKDIEDHQKIFETSQGVHINALKIDEVFEDVLAVFEQND